MRFLLFQRVWAAFKSFWLRAPLAQALLESWSIAFLILLVINSLSHELTNYILGNIIFFVSVDAGFWLALRARMEKGWRWQRILLREFFTGAVQAGLAGAGLVLPLMLLGKTDIFTQSTFNLTGSAAILTCSSLAFYALRAMVWFVSFWNRLRKRSLMWSLTHAHLMVVIIGAVSGVVILTTYSLTTGTLPEVYYNMGPAQRVVSRLLTTLMPVIGVYTVVTIIALGLLLPPSALFSFLFARQTTRRLQKLIQAAHQLRSGEYSARVPVEGEDEVAQLQGDFNGMAETLEGTLARLREEQQQVERLLQARRELVASVSHELRTPVATLRGYLDSALDTPLQEQLPTGPGNRPPAPPDLREDLEVMRRETVRLQELIDDLFTLSRAEVNGLALNMQAVDVETVIRQRVAALAPLAWQTGRVELIADVPANLPKAQADPSRLDQVLVNLLRNALRHTPPGGIIAITAVEEPGWLRVDVRDTGHGISTEDLPRIWDRFYRGQSAKGDTAGAGLGLALVKELTEAMQGDVQVESKAGEGSCFTLRLKKAG